MALRGPTPKFLVDPHYTYGTKYNKPSSIVQLSYQYCRVLCKSFEKGGGVEDNVSAPSHFITNAHNELYAFNTKKATY